LYLQSRGYEVVPDLLSPNEVPARTPTDRAVERGYRKGAKAAIKAHEAKGKADTADHARNFLDCVASRKPCTCDIEVGHRDTSAALVANIAHKIKTYLEWDRKADRSTNSAAATKLLRYAYRAPYKFPT